MDEKDLYIIKLAKFLYENDRTISYTELSEHLNRNFHKEYSEDHGRGMSHIVATLHDKRLLELTESCEKKIGADVSYLQKCLYQIVSEDGSHPWEKQ